MLWPERLPENCPPEIIEIYEFYNKPVLFACKNKTGHLFLVVWIDETDESDIWLYAPISPTRFERIRDGKIDLHTAFADPEDEIVLQVTVYKEPTEISDIALIAAREVDPEWVPEIGEYLNIPDELPPVLWKNVDQRNLVTKRIFDEKPLMAVS